MAIKKWTPDKIEVALKVILEKTATTREGIHAICKSQPGLPCPSTFMAWINDDPSVEKRYARAKEAQADLLAEEIIEIADDGRNDWMEENDPDNPGWRVNHENINRSRVRIDTRKWLAGKLRPKRYGEKVTNEITGADGGPIKTESSPDELSRSILDKLNAMAERSK